MAAIVSTSQWSEPAEAQVSTGDARRLYLIQNAQGRWTFSTTGPAEAEFVRTADGRWKGATPVTGATRLSRTSTGKLMIYEV